jgi:hypothetical protein
MDPERELVVVVRWIDSAYADAFFASVYKAID